MSGFIGVVRFDGGPIDEGLFRGLAERIEYRGPQRSGIWRRGNGAFAHTLLVNGPEAAQDAQPLERRGLVLVADSRVDDRANLARTLALPDDSPDGQLILAAYERWGQECPARLAGDFSFAVWDLARRSLFCARDRFGLRAFFFGRVDGCLVFTNDLHALLRVPRLSATLNEDAIADFLLFGGNQNSRTTSFADISRIAPAHAMTFDAAGCRERRYWSLPAPERPVIIGEQEAVGRFRGIFLDAVGDRVRTGRAVISMSGGVDSTSVAAAARQWSRRCERAVDLSAITSVAHDVRADEEQPFAEWAARSLGIDLVLDIATGEMPFDGWQDERHRGLEPGDDPFNAATVRFFREAARRASVILTGQGGDAVFYTSHGYFYDLLRNGRWLRFASEALRYALTRGRRPPFCLRSRLRRALVADQTPVFPRWIDDDFAKRTSARDRWRHRFESTPAPRHSFRPEACQLVESAMWANLFESYDAAATGCAIEHSTPYFDVRVVEFLFALPPMPHFADKDLLRRSMAGWLPDPVRRRPKAPFAADQYVARMQRVSAASPDILARGRAADPFVKRAILSEEIAARRDGPARHQMTTATSLTRWLTARGYV
jgi:asparagine synthase (glutamine-hydrolysing)